MGEDYGDRGNMSCIFPNMHYLSGVVWKIDIQGVRRATALC